MTVAALTILDLVAQASRGPGSHELSNSSLDLRQAFFNAVVCEYNPTGFAETMLAREIARCGAQMIRDQRMLDATEVQAEQSLIRVVGAATAAVAPGGPPLTIAQICAPERLDMLHRATLRHSNAFFIKLRQLMDLQRDRNSSRGSLQEPDSRFETEAQCIAYLARRIRLGYEPCRRCGQASGGSWIAVRRCWECAACNAQTCVRHGTVMARSHMTLVHWFHAIKIVLYYPKSSASEVAAALSIRRVPTVRLMLAKIRAALQADDASRLLADLDTVYLPPA